MKVVLDANILVSACITDGGNSAKILQQWRNGAIEVLISSTILDEISRVIRYPHLTERYKLSEENVKKFLNLLSKQATVVEPKIELQVVEDDPDDDKYIECAVSAGAEFIITGDKHLLRIENYKGIQILSPASFLAYLQVM